jgi:hypothetical protein
MRQVEEKLKVSHMTIWRVLNEQLLFNLPIYECMVSCLLIFQRERTPVVILFNEILSICFISALSSWGTFL